MSYVLPVQFRLSGLILAIICRWQNLRTAPQSKDQSLTRGEWNEHLYWQGVVMVLSWVAVVCVTGNLALSRNVENGKPVRVIRGYKSRSPYAPEEGYRYDGKKTPGIALLITYYWCCLRTCQSAKPFKRFQLTFIWQMSNECCAEVGWNVHTPFRHNPTVFRTRGKSNGKGATKKPEGPRV